MTLAVRAIGPGTAFLRHQLSLCALSKQSGVKKAAFSTFMHFSFPSLRSNSQSSNALVSRVNISRCTHQPNVQFRFFSSQKDRSECVLTLYHTDKRIADSKWYDTTKVSFSKQTAKKANDIVASYFGVSQEWDKKLLESIFLDDIQLNWFEFTRVNNPDITLGIQISGDRSVVFNENPENFYVPIERPIKLSVTVRSVLVNNSYELDYEQIRKEIARDFSIVALFNSSAFKCVTACSTNLGFARTLERLDIYPS